MSQRYSLKLETHRDEVEIEVSDSEVCLYTDTYVGFDFNTIYSECKISDYQVKELHSALTEYLANKDLQ